MGPEETRTESRTESDDPTATAEEIATRIRKRVARTEEGKGPEKQRRMDDEKTEDEIQQELRRIIGEKAKWKMKEQDETMRQIMRIKERDTLMMILPTGGGKSVLFMLPALIASRGTSVVMMPFVALMDGLIDRA
jgi:superfamily II DNA helicase RecQ